MLTYAQALDAAARTADAADAAAAARVALKVQVAH
jgi:hypothetical protein